MDTIINYNSTKISQTAQDMLNEALSQVKGKTCMLTAHGRHVCLRELNAEMGCNEYNSHINLINNDGGVEAYFCNGQFWSTLGKSEITLI